MDSGAITRDRKGIRRDEPTLDGRDDSNMIKELLKSGFKVERDAFPTQKTVANPVSDSYGRFRSFLVFSFRLLRFFGIPGGRKELEPGITIRIHLDPEPVNKVKVRAQRRQGVWITANKGSEDAVIWEPFNPMGKGRWCETLGNQKEKEDKRAQDLRLVLSGSAGMGVKRQEKFHGSVCIKEQEFLPWFPKFRMEPDSFGRIKRNFRIMEKTFVILHGLPVFDHSAIPPCK